MAATAARVALNGLEQAAIVLPSVNRLQHGGTKPAIPQALRHGVRARDSTLASSLGLCARAAAVRRRGNLCSRAKASFCAHASSASAHTSSTAPAGGICLTCPAHTCSRQPSSESEWSPRPSKQHATTHAASRFHKLRS
eukprot:1826032-Rhodomonas_salina.1